MITTLIVDKDTWKKDYSEQAHKVCFSKYKPASYDRIDFAVIAVDDEQLCGYITCRETNSETIYWQFGGTFPEVIGTVKSIACFDEGLKWAKSLYKRVIFLVENDNYPMLKLAMRFKFKIYGVRNYHGNILLEHMLEF